MQGAEDDDDYEDDRFRAAPHPDDRLWRHPSEMAASAAANAMADTAKIPAITVEPQAAARRTRSRSHAGVYVAAGVVLIGAAALTLGVASLQSSRITAGPTLPHVTTVEARATASLPASSNPTENVAFANPAGEAEASVTQRLHDELAASLPRIQAATPSGMREGSGLFITGDGHIVTSAGLVDGAGYVLVWTDDGSRWVASVLASDGFSDVALLKIDSDDWPAVEMGTGAELWSGQYAFALDHESGTIEIGEVTAVEPAYVVIDQPAAIPGSAIIDDTGAVIGMVKTDGSNQHATPAWLIEKVAVAQITSGSVHHPLLGIVAADSPDGQMAVVNEVIADSPADEAGLRVGDLIDSLNGEPTTGSVGLWRQVHSTEPGAEAVITVTRNGNRRIIIAVLAEVDYQPG